MNMEHKTLDLANCEIVMDDVGSFEGYAATFGNPLTNWQFIRLMQYKHLRHTINF